MRRVPGGASRILSMSTWSLLIEDLRRFLWNGNSVLDGSVDVPKVGTIDEILAQFCKVGVHFLSQL